ncbi:ISNCY family transposase [Vibrio ouci]|uniref:ISNCY family transposase n=1 Tax=Vibrio ouci TaxID=2499078 RepID=A0A4Y8WCV7_9VIBR|nr:ISNCY family transposase [Vibrio ouci]TFH90198.1 ISNCY family transposase [Vibrio ouci]
MEGYLTLSHKELDRLTVIKSVHAGRLLQKEAASQLDLSVRQIKRLLARFRAEGAKGLISRHRGKKPNNAYTDATREAAIQLVRAHYTDFGPTLASEKLEERHGIKISRETLRTWMIDASIWVTKGRKKARIHQRRKRRSRRGELIQIDGSPHAWFEERGEYCTLIVFIDDATSELMAMKFTPAETTQAYMETLDDYLVQHGRPVALYSDKHSIFRVSYPERDGELTQFTRAIKTLDIEPIHANSAQAKGRVERANGILQDRLVKELRLRGISDIETANAFIPELIEQYNKRFAIAPNNDHDAHRKVLYSEEEVELIFSIHHHRKVSKNLTFQYKNSEYQITNEGKGYRLRHSTVTVCESFNGEITVLSDGRKLDCHKFIEGPEPIPLDDEKSIHHTVNKVTARINSEYASKYAHKPKVDHPWRSRNKVRVPAS